MNTVVRERKIQERKRTAEIARKTRAKNMSNKIVRLMIATIDPPTKPKPETLGDYYPIKRFKDGVVIVGGDEEVWRHQFIFPGTLDAEDVVERVGQAYYSGPGRPFADAPVWEHNGTSTLVYQRGGWDI